MGKKKGNAKKKESSKQEEGQQSTQQSQPSSSQQGQQPSQQQAQQQPVTPQQGIQQQQRLQPSPQQKQQPRPSPQQQEQQRGQQQPVTPQQGQLQQQQRPQSSQQQKQQPRPSPQQQEQQRGQQQQQAQQRGQLQQQQRSQPSQQQKQQPRPSPQQQEQQRGQQQRAQQLPQQLQQQRQPSPQQQGQQAWPNRGQQQRPELQQQQRPLPSPQQQGWKQQPQQRGWQQQPQPSPQQRGWQQQQPRPSPQQQGLQQQPQPSPQQQGWQQHPQPSPQQQGLQQQPQPSPRQRGWQQQQPIPSPQQQGLQQQPQPLPQQRGWQQQPQPSPQQQGWQQQQQQRQPPLHQQGQQHQDQQRAFLPPGESKREQSTPPALPLTETPQTPKKKPSTQKQKAESPAPSSTASQRSTSSSEVQLEAAKGDSGAHFIIPKRKKLKTAGTLGRSMRIETNHLALQLQKLGIAIHYDVAIDPDKPKKMLRHVVEQFRRQNYPDRYPAFDGVKNLYSSSMLPFGTSISGEVDIMIDDRQKTYKVDINFAARVDLSVLNEYFGSTGAGGRHMVTPQDAIQCLDIVLRSAPSLNCVQAGRSFFTRPQRPLSLGDGMELYHGFYQSAILGWKPFLNVDVAHKAFPKCLNLIDLIFELCPNFKIETPMYREDTDVVSRFLRTLKIQYEIPGNAASRRVWRINGLREAATKERFKNEDNQEMTVHEYFTNVKHHRLRYPHLPCLWVGSRDRNILLPMELCTLVEGQVLNRAMTPTQTSNLIREAATSTRDRKRKIMDSIKFSRYNQDPTIREFGITVAGDFTEVGARKLDPPSLRYNNNRTVMPARGQWRATSFLAGKSIDKWYIMCYDGRTRLPALQDFAEMIIRQGREYGMDIQRPVNILPLQCRSVRDAEKHFRDAKGAELILVVISEEKNLYHFVKQAAELTVGVLTQCVLGKNVFRPKPATVANIMLKINAKLNGVNHILAQTPKCLKRPCMIMGADVTHPSPESRGAVPSVAAVTASHDNDAFKYNICWRLQPSTQEIITDLYNIVREHLKYYFKSNGKKPEKIIFFRDGVSEGQFQIVLDSEINSIRAACKSMQKDGTYQPGITFLVVQKRHHTRFFPLNERDSEDRNMNVPAGTVVDTEITHPTALDFYLVSHASIQGVARPTKYRKLYDDNDMEEDELEELTYHLCHMFTRCTRSVSYPAPTYYAHLAAARAKVYTERQQLDMNNLAKEQTRFVINRDVTENKPMFFV